MDVGTAEPPVIAVDWACYLLGPATIEQTSRGSALRPGRPDNTPASVAAGLPRIRPAPVRAIPRKG